MFKIQNTQQQLTDIIYQLSRMLKSGLDLQKCVSILLNSPKTTSLTPLLQTTLDTLDKGQPLSKAFTFYPQFFDQNLIELIKIGEGSGTLDQVLNNIAQFRDQKRQFFTKIKKDALSPLISLSFAFLLFNFMVHIKLWYFIFIFLLYLFFKIFISPSSNFKEKRDLHILRFPVLGLLMRRIILVEIFQNLNLMVRSGLHIDKAINHLVKISKNSSYQKSLQNIKINVLKGNPVYIGLFDTFLFPTPIQQLVCTGETTGQLEEMTQRLVILLQEEVDLQLHVIINLVKPALTVIAGLVIGYDLVQTYTPIFHVADSIK